MENSSSKEKNDVIENLESKTLTIEHIMPQTLSNEWKLALGDDYERIHEEWLHTIANLTLSGYNPNYSNKSFKEMASARAVSVSIITSPSLMTGQRLR